MNTNANDSKKCPSCGQSLPAGALAGLCPVCLLDQGAETEPADTEDHGRFQPPTLESMAALFPGLEILGLLGAGGMGAVYQARQPSLDRRVALKVLPAGGRVGSAERFNREARALARLNHPNIVAVHEFGQVENYHYFIMEFVDGANLRQLEKTSRLSPREALEIIPQICDALQYAHDEGVVHRDIKPENVLIDRKGRVKIADFGLAKIVDPDPEAARLTVEGQVMGTPHYMAPEQVERPLAVDHRADIYALGVVFYEMLTGDLPLGKFAPLSRKVQVDVRLDDIVLRALENDPDRRYQHASDVKSEVQTVVAGPGDEQSASMQEPEDRRLRWLGIPVAKEGNGTREIEVQGALGAIVVVMACAAIAHMFVRWLTGREHAMASLVTLVGVVTVVLGIRRAINRSWSPEPRVRFRRFVFDALMLVALMVFVVGSHYGVMAIRDPGAQESSFAQNANLQPDTGALSVTLPGGGIVELLAVADAGAAPNQWWRPDGTPETNFTYELVDPVESSVSGRASKDFLFRMVDLPPGAGLRGLSSGLITGASSGGQVKRSGQLLPGVMQFRSAFPPEASEDDFDMAFALEPWHTIATQQAHSQSSNQERRLDELNWQVLFHLPTRNELGEAQISTVVSGEDERWAYQVVAVDTNGMEHASTNAQGTPFESATLWTCTFGGLPIAQTHEFRFQVRRLHRVRFANVQLKPSTPLPDIPVGYEPTRATDQVAQGDSASGIWFADLPEGGRIELLAVGQVDAAPDVWWRPDGAPVRGATYTVRNAEPAFAPSARPWDLIFQLKGLSEGTQLARHNSASAFNYGGWGEITQNGQPLADGRHIRVAWPPSARHVTLRLGFGMGEWKTLSTHLPPGRSMIRDTGSALPRLDYMLHNVVDAGNGARATFATGKRDDNWRTRVVAIDNDGMEHAATVEGNTPGRDSDVADYIVPGLKATNIRHLVVQVQPLHWVAFKDIALAPNQPESPGTTLVFGPPQEMEFEGLLDLDTGRIGEFPTGSPEAPDTGAAGNVIKGIGDNLTWMQEQGFDLEARSGAVGLLGVRVVELIAPDWNLMAPETLEARLRDWAHMPTELPLTITGVPRTLGFRTREGTSGIMQLVSADPTRPLVHLRRKLVTAPHPQPVLEAPSQFSADALAAEPELRFLAWQDQWRSNGVASAYTPGGLPVTEKTDVEILRRLYPPGFDFSANTAGHTNPPFIHLWFAHPGIDRQSLVGVTLTDGAGRPLKLGANGGSSSRSQPADVISPDRGWILCTVSPGEAKTPSVINVQLEYAVGALERERTIKPDFRGGIALEGNGQLSGIGSNQEGKSFVALAVDTLQLGARQFGVVAVTQDGREITQSGGGSSGPSAGGLSVQQFEFDLPLSEVKHFKIGTRPVRTATWKRVVLPPLPN